MSSNLIPLSFDSQSVRVIDQPSGVWFVAVDVCNVLDLSNPTEAIRNLDDDEVSALSITEVSSNGVQQKRSFNIISESGLYALIFRSRKAEAKRFRKWVTSEVLPAIRKTGTYAPAAITRAEVEQIIAERLPRRILKRREVEAVTGLARATIYAYMQEGKFPQAVKLGASAVGWVEDEVQAWIKDRMNNRTLTNPELPPYYPLVERFVNECIELAPHNTIAAADIYGAFKEWCWQNGFKAIAQNAFGRALSIRGLERTRTYDSKCYCGIQLKVVEHE